MSSIRDGNNIKAPRNLNKLLEQAREAQLRSEDRVPTEFTSPIWIIEADSVQTCSSCSQCNACTRFTLLAEASELVPLLQKFRDGKAEHNTKSISIILGVSEDEARLAAKLLEEIGFLEEVGSAFKIPMLYREAMAITQGKAYR